MAKKSTPAEQPNEIIADEMQETSSEQTPETEGGTNEESGSALSIEAINTFIADQKAAGKTNVRLSDDMKRWILGWIITYNKENKTNGGATKISTDLGIDKVQFSNWRTKLNPSTVTVTGRTITTKSPAERKEPYVAPAAVNKEAVIRLLVELGIDYSETIEWKKDAEGKVQKVTRVDGSPILSKINFQYGEMGSNDKGVYITQTNPMIKVTTDLRTFMDLVGLKAK